MMALLLFGTFFLLVFLNVPIAAALGISGVIGLVASGQPVSILATSVNSAVGKYTLLAIPFFILAGVIMEYAGISKRLIRLARVCIGHRKSGMVSVTVIVSCFFAAISGSGPATVAALGAVLIPAMVDAGYDKGTASALMSASGAIGIVIPPSIAFVIYASITDVSISKLFSGGIIPGILLGVSYVLATLWLERKNTAVVRQEKASWSERWAALKDAVWGLLMPVIILGGIYGGIFTATEAAGVAIVYGLFVGTAIYKEIKLFDLRKIFVDAAVSSGTVLYIVMCASIFAWVLTATNLAADISSALLAVTGNKYILLLLVNLVFLITGCFLDASSAFYILVPIIAPVMTAVGVDLVHLGVMLTINMAIGLVTPPVGINLYVGCNISGTPVHVICRKIVPYVVAGVAVLLLITFVPQICLGL